MYLYLHLRPPAADLKPGHMKSATKRSAKAVDGVQAAVGALPGKNKPDPASQHDAGDGVAAVAPLEEKEVTVDDSLTGQKAKKTPRQCNPKAEMTIDSPRWCSHCWMWLNGPIQYLEHSSGKKHRKSLNRIGEHRRKIDTHKGIVAPHGTVLIIEQCAILADATEKYMLSLYAKAILRARL